MPEQRTFIGRRIKRGTGMANGRVGERNAEQCIKRSRGNPGAAKVRTKRHDWRKCQRNRERHGMSHGFCSRSTLIKLTQPDFRANPVPPSRARPFDRV
jgi:hypothetical protein